MIEQISVFLEDKKGELATITSLLSKSDISIIAINLSEGSDFGILRLIVSDTKRAKEVISNKGFSSSITPLLGIKIEDRVGSFSRVVDILSSNDIDIKYTYTISNQKVGIFVFKVESSNFHKAKEILQKNGIETIETL